MPEAERGGTNTEACYPLPGYNELTAGEAAREARLWAQAGKASHPKPPEAGHFSHWTAPVPCGWSCGGKHHF